MIRCPNCNAELNFNVDSQRVTCEYCKTAFDPHNLEVKIKKAQELTYEGKGYLCSQCGAELLTFDETAITFCSYCGSQAMIESKMIRQNNPDFIIPFKKTKEECILAYKKKISRFLFAPSYMKSNIIVEKFRGIYIPYCIYKLSFHDKIVNKGSKYSYRSGDYVYYTDYDIYSDVDADYDGISYDLISNFYDKFSQSIPYDYKEIENFNSNYLSGFYADTADVDITLYEKNATFIANVDSVNYMKKERKFAKYGCKNPNVNLKVAEKSIGMFPLYFLAIRDKENKYMNYAVVNGQTGKVALDLPIDVKKYILISILLAIPIFLLINNFIVITPKNICIFFVVFALISLIISKYQLNKIYERQNHSDDVGYVAQKSDINYKIKIKNTNGKSVIILVIVGFLLFDFITPIIIIILEELNLEGVGILVSLILILLTIIIFLKRQNNQEADIKLENYNIKPSKKDKRKYTYKSKLAIIIGIIILILNFIDDLYYYGAVLIMFGLIVWSFSDLIKGHNLIVSTKIPQLEKRGGDENE